MYLLIPSPDQCEWLLTLSNIIILRKLTHTVRDCYQQRISKYLQTFCLLSKKITWIWLLPEAMATYLSILLLSLPPFGKINESRTVLNRTRKINNNEM